MGTTADNVYKLLHKTVGNSTLTEGFRVHRGNEQLDIEVLMTPFEMEICRQAAIDGPGPFREHMEETWSSFCGALPSAEPRCGNIFGAMRDLCLS